MDLFQIIIPEFIFHENDEVGLHDIQEAAGIPGAVHREVKDPVCPIVILPDFIAGR